MLDLKCSEFIKIKLFETNSTSFLSPQIDENQAESFGYTKYAEEENDRLQSATSVLVIIAVTDKFC